MEGHEGPLGVPIQLEEVEEVLQEGLRLRPTASGPLDEVPIVGQRGVHLRLEEPLVVVPMRCPCIDDQLDGPLLLPSRGTFAYRGPSSEPDRRGPPEEDEAPRRCGSHPKPPSSRVHKVQALAQQGPSDEAQRPPMVH